jgi:transcriptional regulator with XRE-family HTH domain
VKYYKDQDFINKVGQRLREIRLAKGYTQEDLSVEAGFPASQVGRTERGEINFSISHVAAYARVLGVHPKELLDVDFDLVKKKRK